MEKKEEKHSFRLIVDINNNSEGIGVEGGVQANLHSERETVIVLEKILEAGHELIKQMRQQTVGNSKEVKE